MATHRPTLLVSPDSLEGDHYEVRGDAHRHLFRARRLAPGEEIRVVDGAGQARLGVVTDVQRDSARLRLADPLPALAAGRVVSLWVAVPRLERASWLVEKACELGVTRIAWFMSEHTHRELHPKHLKRLARVAAAALEQCGGALLPEISDPVPWQAMLETLDQEPVDTAVLDPSHEASVPEFVRSERALRLIVGPEGGLAAEELVGLDAHGVMPWWLGNRILRVETAAIAATAIAFALVPADAGRADASG